MRLSDCFVDLFALVSHAMDNPGNYPPSGEALCQSVAHLIGQSEMICEEYGFDMNDFEAARFAVFAWIDETVMKSGFEGKTVWRKQLLQRTYYHTAGGGVEFYKRLEEMDEDKKDVREVFFLCLSLGFSGRYGLNEGDTAAREKVRIQQLKRLTGSSGFPELTKEKFFPCAYGLPAYDKVDKPVKKTRSLMATVFFGAGPVAVFVFLYVLYQFILDKEIVTKVVQ